MSAHQKMGIDSRRAWVEPTGRDRGSAALSAPPPEASAERQQAGCHGKWYLAFSRQSGRKIFMKIGPCQDISWQTENKV